MKKPNVIKILPLVEKEIREILKDQGFKMTHVSLSSTNKKLKIEIEIKESENE